MPENNFYLELLSYRPETKYSFVFGRDCEVKNCLRWCGAVRNNTGSPLVIKGKSGVGKSTLLRLLYNIVISNVLHPYCAEREWASEKEYDTFIYKFKAFSILHSPQDNLFENIAQFGRPRSIKQSTGGGASILGAGGNFSLGYRNNDLSNIGKFLKKIASSRETPVVFFIDTAHKFDVDIGESIKYMCEYATKENIGNLHFALAVNESDFQLSDYFKTQCIVIDLKPLSNEDLLNYAKYVSEANQLQIPKTKLEEYAHNCNNDINKLKHFLNGEKIEGGTNYES